MPEAPGGSLVWAKSGKEMPNSNSAHIARMRVSRCGWLGVIGAVGNSSDRYLNPSVVKVKQMTDPSAVEFAHAF